MKELVKGSNLELGSVGPAGECCGGNCDTNSKSGLTGNCGLNSSLPDEDSPILF